MAVVMTPIYTQVAGASGVSTFLFNNIPQHFTDLMIVCSLRTTATDTGYGTQVVLYVNGNYYPATASSFTELTFNSSVAGSGRDSGQYIRLGYAPSGTTTASTFGSLTAVIPNYSGSMNKSVISEGVSENLLNTANSVVSGAWSGLIRSTSPVTSLSIDSGRTFAQYSSVSLYGILRYGV